MCVRYWPVTVYTLKIGGNRVFPMYGYLKGDYIGKIRRDKRLCQFMPLVSDQLINDKVLICSVN